MACRLTALIGLGSVLVLLAGCDSASPVTALDGLEPSSISADAASALASAVALGPGGALNDLADAALATSGAAHGSPHAGCEYERYWDASLERWVRDVTCERGDPDGPAYALFSRLHHFGFFDAAGGVVQQPANAVRMSVDLLEGEGVRRTPRMSHTLLDIGAAFVVDDIQEEFVTVNGDYARAATDSLRAGQRSRVLTYELSLEFEDVVGPRRPVAAPPEPPGGLSPLPALHRQWAGSVSGSIHGQISGVITVTGPNGSQTHEFERTFTITFGEGDPGFARLRFARSDHRFEIDLVSGEVREG